jgi:CHAT domain-containing protein
LVARSRSDLAVAEAYIQQALAIKEKLAPDSLDVASSLHNLGSIAISRGDVAGAERYIQRALAIKEKLAPDSLDVASSLNNLGLVARSRSDLAVAEAYFQRSMAIVEKLGIETKALADALRNLAWVFHRKGEMESSVLYSERSLNAAENQVARLGGTEEERSGYMAANSASYREFIDTLLDPRLGREERAFGVLERSRARSLLNMLAQRDLVFAGDLPRDVQRARRLNAAEYDRTQAGLSTLNPSTDIKQIEQRIARLRELNADGERMMDQIRKVSPRFAALQYPQPLDFASTRSALDAGTVLLSYSVGKNDTLLFVIQPENSTPGLSVFRLPITASALRQKVEAFRKLIDQHNTNDQQALAAQARELYNVLIRPAESALEPSQRLLIIADGSLHILPFAALMRGEKQYLVEWKPIHSAVSATVYAELKKNRRATTDSGADDLVAFGDPQYPRAEESKPEKILNAELRSAVERGLGFPRLAFSRQEVQSIAALYPGHNRTYLGAEATEERAKSLGKQVRYIHFATHGVLDEQFPLNSALVLTIPGKIAEGQDNGLLQAWEIFDQVRIDADLVTLSACGTALGKEMGGEGLIGLTRAFQYAGGAQFWRRCGIWTISAPPSS